MTTSLQSSKRGRARLGLIFGVVMVMWFTHVNVASAQSVSKRSSACGHS